MKDIKGNKTVDLSIGEFNELRSKFEKVVIDLGAGDGRFVYKSALINPNTLFIGVDPAPKQMEEFSRKAVRKKIENVLFVVGSFELLPQELKNCADKLYVILPWGTLLKTVTEPTSFDVEKLRSLLKNRGEIELVFGYNSELESSQTNRLQLDKIDESKIIQKFENAEFKLLQSSTLSSREMKKLESTWGKRIGTTKERKIFRLVFHKC